MGIELSPLTFATHTGLWYIILVVSCNFEMQQKLTEVVSADVELIYYL